MNRLGIATVGLAIMIVFALGIYFNRGPSPSVLPETSVIGEATSLNLLQGPRVLPTIRFADEKARAITLQDFRGKFVLLNLWATWCPPCLKEMPSLDRLQAALGGLEFEVVALSIDRGGASVVRAFYDEIGVKSLHVYIDQDGQSLPALGVNGVPATLLIDREGREIARKIGPAEWDSPEVVTLIKGYLGTPAPEQPGRR